MAEALRHAALWADAGQRIEAEFGLNFGELQQDAIERGFGIAASSMGQRDAASCARALAAGTLSLAQRRLVAQALTIGETYFFRDPAVFDALALHVLKPLVEARRAGSRHLRLWSAGCASGEEAYSLAMLVATMLPDWRQWNVSILATDLNAAALAKAAAGVYGPWSLRGGIPAAANAYLQPRPGNLHEVAPELRQMVHFAPLNLAGADFPSALNGTAALDLILCRNVLMYFRPARALGVLERLGRCLVPDGWLVPGSVELPTARLSRLAPVRAAEMMALRRLPPPLPAAPPPPPAARARQVAPTATARAAGVAREKHPAPAPAGPPVDAAVLAQRSRAAADAGDLQSAERLCREALAADSLNPDWSYLLATIHAERGDEAAALAALRRTLYLDAHHVLAHVSLGALLLRQGSPAGRRHLAQARAQLAGTATTDVVHNSGGLCAGDLQAMIRRLEEEACT